MQPLAVLCATTLASSRARAFAPSSRLVALPRRQRFATTPRQAPATSPRRRASIARRPASSMARPSSLITRRAAPDVAADFTRYAFMLPTSIGVASTCQLCGIGGAALFSPIFLLVFPLLGDA